MRTAGAPLDRARGARGEVSPFSSKTATRPSVDAAHPMDKLSLGSSPVPRRAMPDRDILLTPGLLEPAACTPRARSHTRPSEPLASPAAAAESPSPIARGGMSYTSLNRSTALPLADSAAERHASGAKLASGQQSRGGLSRPARTAAEDPRGLRSRRPRAAPLPPSPSNRRSPRRAALSSPADTGATRRGRSSLALALRAQWAVQQQQQQQQQPHGASTRREHAATAAVEQDLLRTLSSIPSRDLSSVLDDAEEVAPYLLAFSAAPRPTARTQAVALAALQGIIEALPAAWGSAATSALVEDLFLGAHDGLGALEMALARELVAKTKDAADLAAVLAVGSARQPSVPHEDAAQQAALLRLAVIDSIIGLLFDAVLLCRAVASAVLSHALLLKSLIGYCSEATASQAACIARTLQALMDPSPASAQTGSSPAYESPSAPSSAALRGRAVEHAAEAACVLASYNAHHAIIACIRASVRATYNGRGDLAATATVTTLCTLMRVAIQLVPAGGAYDTLVCEDGMSVLLAQLLTLPWGEVLELAALWIAALLAQFAEREDAGPVLARNILTKPDAVRVLVRMLRWEESDTISYATSVALCWRWLCLVAGEQSAAAECIAESAELTLELVQATLRHPLPSTYSDSASWAGPARVHVGGARRKSGPSVSDGEVAAASPRAEPLQPHPQRQQQYRAKALLAVELTLVPALAFALGTEFTRATTHLCLLEQLPSTAIHALRDRVHDTLAAVDDTYFTRFPTVLLDPNANEVAEVARQRLERAKRRSGSRTRSHSAERGRGAAVPFERTPSPSRSASSHSVRRSRDGLEPDPPSLESGAAPQERMARVRAGAGDQHADPQSGAMTPQLVVSSPRQWRALVEASWELLLSGEPSQATERQTLRNRLRVGAASEHLRVLGSSPDVSPWRAADGLRSASATAASMRSGERVQRATAAAAAVPRVPSAPQVSLSYAAAETARTLPPHARCAVVERALQLADSDAVVQQSVEVVLRLAHQYVQSGVLGAPELPLTSITDESVRRLQYEESAFQQLLTESPQYRPAVESIARARSSSCPSRASSRSSSPPVMRALPAASVGSASTAGRRGLASATRTGRPVTVKEKLPANPWAPPPRAHQSRRWSLRDLRRSDVLVFALGYETLVRDLAEAVQLVFDHISHLRQQLQVCPTRDVVRRLVLNDLYRNVYPKLHLFLRYVQHQVARSRAVLQLLAEEAQDRNGMSLHSGNLIEMYDAVGHCVGDA